MKKRELTVKNYDENGNYIDETILSYELTPSNGKCFIDTRNNEKIIRKSDGLGAVIEIPPELLEFYKEVDLF